MFESINRYLESFDLVFFGSIEVFRLFISLFKIGFWFSVILEFDNEEDDYFVCLNLMIVGI